MNINCNRLQDGAILPPSLWECRIVSLYQTVSSICVVVFFFFNWRIIALQCSVCFCCTTMWTSCESESRPVVSDSVTPMDYTVHGILQARILEWVAFPFSRGSSQPRDRIQVSCIAGGFFTSWATREAHEPAIFIHIYPPSGASLPPHRISPLFLHRAELPVLYSRFPLASSSQFVPPSPPPRCPKVHSLCLHLSSCLAYRFTSTIFLDSIYMWRQLHF